MGGEVGGKGFIEVSPRIYALAQEDFILGCCGSSYGYCKEFELYSLVGMVVVLSIVHVLDMFLWIPDPTIVLKLEKFL